MKFRTALILILFFFLFLVSCATTEKESRAPIVGIAWRDDTSSSAFKRVKEYLEEGGAEVIVLEKAMTADLEYYEDTAIKDDYLQFDFSLSSDAVDIVKTTENIIEPASLGKVDLVVFTGGEDISPYFYGDSYLSDYPIYNPDRDISDYLTMRLAMEKGIPIFGICRGMQMMAIYSGASLVIDLPQYFAERGEEEYRHRSVTDSYTFHSVTIVEDSFLSGLDLDRVASSHHQALLAGGSGDYKVLAVDGEIVEAIEIEPSSYGIQFHPEFFVDFKDSKEWCVSLEILKKVIAEAMN